MRLFFGFPGDDGAKYKDKEDYGAGAEGEAISSITTIRTGGTMPLEHNQQLQKIHKDNEHYKGIKGNKPQYDEDNVLVPDDEYELTDEETHREQEGNEEGKEEGKGFVEKGNFGKTGELIKRELVRLGRATKMDKSERDWILAVRRQLHTEKTQDAASARSDIIQEKLVSNIPEDLSFEQVIEAAKRLKQ